MSSENVDDRLSAMPEEIVSHILSLMPTGSAVRTSILSKRWRHSWMYVTNLDFDNPCDLGFSSVDESSKLEKFVDQVLEFCKSSQLKLFRLHLDCTTVPESCISRWIVTAMRLNVREVDIQLLMNDLPLNLLTCSKTLTKLRLDCPISINNSLSEGSYPVNLPCLKILDIVSSADPLINVFKLIYGSPILECLSLIVHWIDDDEEEIIFNIPTLKQLRLTLTYSLTYSNPPSFIDKIVLNLPNLEYLYVGGKCLCSLFVVENLSSLFEASVSYHDIGFDHRWFELVKGLKEVTSLSIRNFDFVPSKNRYISCSSSWPIFLNMEHLELKGSYDFRLIFQFLESSPHLKHLCVEKFDNPSFKEKDYEKYSWIEVITWIKLKSVPACMLKSLTTIKFLKCANQKWDMEFLKYMLGNTRVLKKVTVVPEKLCLEEETRFCAEILKLPKASPDCEIQFLGSCSSSTGIN